MQDRALCGIPPHIGAVVVQAMVFVRHTVAMWAAAGVTGEYLLCASGYDVRLPSLPHTSLDEPS